MKSTEGEQIEVQVGETYMENNRSKCFIHFPLRSLLVSSPMPLNTLTRPQMSQPEDKSHRYES